MTSAIASRMRRKFSREIAAAGLTEGGLAPLPEAARRDLRFTGAGGRSRDTSFRLHARGRLRPSRKPDWLDCQVWQYSSQPDVARIFHMRLRMAGLLPVYDSYLGGRGRSSARSTSSPSWTRAGPSATSKSSSPTRTTASSLRPRCSSCPRSPGLPSTTAATTCPSTTRAPLSERRSFPPTAARPLEHAGGRVPEGRRPGAAHARFHFEPGALALDVAPANDALAEDRP